MHCILRRGLTSSQSHTILQDHALSLCQKQAAERAVKCLNIGAVNYKAWVTKFCLVYAGLDECAFWELHDVVSLDRNGCLPDSLRKSGFDPGLGEQAMYMHALLA